TEHIIHSNDWPEIYLAVCGLKYPANGFKDLAFLISEGFKEGDLSPEKFLIFFDNTKKAEHAIQWLQKQLPKSLQDKIKYFHSTMTQSYHEDEFQALKDSDTWGLCSTDAFGMGMDLPDIKLIIQWKATCDFCMLWQQFGQEARQTGQTAVALLLVKQKDTDDARKKK
ncbi:P-loop containing nucleoside triphosphate hydrolase protein, partial [Collybia nuda]